MNPRKSNARKYVSGTARNDRAAQLPGEALDKCPPPPTHLSPRGKVEWKRLAPAIHAIGTLRTVDLFALELLAETLATASDAAAVIRAEGMTSKTADGNAKGHPATKILETARAQASRLMIEFGLTPRSRGSVDAAPAPGSRNEFEDIDPLRSFV